MTGNNSTVFRKTFFTYFILSFLCFIFMVSSENKVIRFLKDVDNTVFYPFRLVVRGIQQELIAFKKVFVGKDSTKIELEKLQIELENYKQELINFNAISQENDRLKDLLSLKKNLDYNAIISNVIGRDFVYSYAYITLNKGRMDGIEDNLPVIAFIDGVKVVVGIVTETNLLTSKVRTIKSDLMSLGVYLPRTDIHSVVEGLGGNSKDIQLLYIDKDVPVQKGDLIYTSVESTLFPPNLLLGSINSIDSTNKTSNTYQIYITPATNFQKISEVFVLKSKKSP